MRSSYTKIYIHFIWATWKRQNIIDADLEPILFKLISDRIHEHKCQLLKIGGTEDHIHLLVDMHPSTCVSNLVKSIKGFSSYSISNKIRPGSFFKWQGGYGAMTVSQNDISILSKYIANQKTHHSQKSIDSRWEIGGV
ncbi:MAG: IS200/IS605 family transposase [Gammaproteobacteria bacterium]|nr:IS200/IS605 family transposase [Gammaproteobacteria bacterium]